ncbi:hypothetical protein Q648_00112 [Bartonella quintana JK 12]|uniref:Uncharacterized protein n=1 Tax=Bartonella quintana JK 68 TaxID=1134503 RepID=A0ABR4SQD3_BARQI|nr:hypothetical protein Q651_00392 [Bartonella quintana BQ2-D70]ETS17598.1 hypothetical protein Q647_00522 [Bartonella quintana JK 7]ETS18428.1 hypothetical protein Q648_00112 [Bartonella quintana JK 12]KEC62502.1 hypothetical protein O7Y_00539 [Bartonella quintana JK 63]KEC63640.1 hypothetical protein O91_00375 [Bartonella quintana JK 31]KEC66193.1 hypothetical protein O7U_00724 [Bartonella quintana JK 68]KEC66387.1 hypothetical protein O7W_00086 [Bartonella quintana JK 56]KEC67210.1 hypoth
MNFVVCTLQIKERSLHKNSVIKSINQKNERTKNTNAYKIWAFCSIALIILFTLGLKANS